MRHLHIGVPVFELHIAEGALTAENHAAERLSGGARVALSEALAPGEPEELTRLAARAARAGLSVSAERSLTWRRGGAPRQGLFEVTASAPAGAERVTLTLVDQSDWAEQRHSASHFTHFLRRLLDLTSTLFFVLDRDRRVVFANEAFSQHLGVSGVYDGGGGARGAQVKLTPQRARGLDEHLFEVIDECLRSGRPRATQASWPSRNKERKVFQMLLQPLTGSGEAAEQVLVLGSDITALVSAHEEQEQLQRALNEAKRLDAIGQMAGTIAHDFNGFLTVILSSVSLLELEAAGEEQEELLKGITAVCEQARQLTRDLLSYSRSQVSAAERGATRKIITHLSFALPRLSRPHSKVTWRAAPCREAEVALSEAQCSQIVVNLVNNALEAIPSDRRGEVRVSCEEREGRLLIAVQDNGDGVPEELLESIFEPFFTTKRGKGGTGLGLASARSLVKKAGGELSVTSARGAGATFTVTLPLLDAGA